MGNGVEISVIQNSVGCSLSGSVILTQETSLIIIQQLIVRPDGREKVEIFGPHEGAYGFRLWQRKRKAWRRALEICRFESYARAVIEAAKHADWLVRAHAHSYHLELHRGLRFRFAEYQQEFGQHDHCLACWATIMWGDPAQVETEGYVTRYSIPVDTGQFQSHWVCKRCFSALREVMQWSLEYG